HTQYLRIVAVERFDILLGRLEILATFVQANQRIANLQARYRIRRECGLPLQRVLANGFERFLLRQVFDVFGLFDGGCAVCDRVEEGLHFRLAVLRFQNLYAQIDRTKIGRRHRGVGRRDDFGSALIDQVAELRAARKCEQPEFGRRIAGTGERALHIFLDGLRILALALVNRTGFVGIEGWIQEAVAALVQQPQRVVEIV